MLKSITRIFAAVVLIFLASACGSEEKGVYFPSLNDGDTVTSPFTVEMGVKGMQVEPAGKVNEGFGHHHLIIDGTFVQPGIMVPADATHIHYGGGQTVTEDIILSPGVHTLTLQFADGVHASYGEEMSKTIQITVE